MTKGSTTKSNGAFTIQPLKDSEIYSGAGTGFTLLNPDGSQSEAFFGYENATDEVNLRVNNTLYKVKQVSSQVIAKGKGRQGIGEHCIETWTNGKLTLELDYKTTSAGEGGVGYSGKATVKMGGQQSTFKIRGGSGC